MTRFATELESVELKVAQTSTVISEAVVTTSNVDTATEVTYVTTTVGIGPGASPRAEPRQPMDLASGVSSPLSLLLRRLTGRDILDGPTSPFAPRQDPVPEDAGNAARNGGYKLARQAASTTTTTLVVSVISTVSVTSTVRTTMTVLTTSVALVTSIRTRTRSAKSRTIGRF